MTPMTKQRMEEHLNKQYAELNANHKEICDLKERLKAIAAENESLRMDKRWLQTVVQNLIPRSPNALTR